MSGTKQKPDSPRLAAWLTDALAEPISAALMNAGIELKAAAGDGTQHIARIEESDIAIEICTDPRDLLRQDVDAVLIADPALSLDTEILATMINDADRNDTRLFTLTPRPAEFAEAIHLRAAGHLPRPVPLIRDFALGRAIFDAASSFGTVDAVQVSLDTTWPCGNCSGRLFDGFDILQEFLGTPLTVEAASSGRIREEAGPILERVMAIARYPDGRVASVSAGDDAGGWSRAVTIWGPSGRLRWIDGVLEFSDGTTSSCEPRTRKELDPVEQFSAELAESIAYVSTQPRPSINASRRIDVLAAVEACMLSVRTGERESVERVRAVFDRV